MARVGLATAEQYPILRGIVDTPFRDITGPVLRYLAGLRGERPHLFVVYIPEYVVGDACVQLLHDPSALRLEVRPLCERVVLVTSVPWQLQSSRRSEQAE